MRQTDPMSDRRARLSAARLYLVCGARPGGRDLREVVCAAVAGGVDVVQLREKERPERELAALASTAADLCRRLGVLFIVNDHPRLALQVGADGVHVGQRDMPVGRAREIVGAELLVGLSTHAPGEVDAAQAGGADYLGVGPVHETPTKPGRPAVGTPLVSYAAEHAGVPFFAIGGIDLANVGEVVCAGASRVCVVRAIGEAADPAAAARQLRRALEP